MGHKTLTQSLYVFLLFSADHVPMILIPLFYIRW